MNEKDLKRLVCFDTETTGLDEQAEIVQLAIVNGLGDVLFDELIKPSHTDAWPQAEAIHHISPEMVADKETIDGHYDRIMEILNDAQYYVGYNILYDIRMLKQVGIPMDCFHRHGTRVIDVMKNFAPIYGEVNERYGGFKWQKLIKCAEYYKYDWGSDKAHGALADTKATLFCFKEMARQKGLLE
jgi:DNA polymerase-3 subunit epsilon